eukprot:scaffold8069_cov52-Attheya_sp.AAC.5
MAEPATGLRFHDNQSFQDQLGYAVHPSKYQTMVHFKPMLVSLVGHHLRKFSRPRAYDVQSHGSQNDLLILRRMQHQIARDENSLNT